MKKKKVLVIVAHPDDETIWCGGTLLMNKDKWEISIISLCRKDDKDRAPKFRKACEDYNAECYISDLDDERMDNVKSEEIINRIKNFVDGKSFDLVFTHGSNGEYGHKRHKDVHKAVLLMVNNRELITNELFTFSYAGNERDCAPDKNSDKFINLDELSFMNKKQIIQHVYGFSRGSFEEKCCKRSESFNVKIK